MAVAALSIDLSPGDLATLQEVPRQIQTLARTAAQMLQAIQSGADSRNPVGALLGGLTQLGDEAGKLPAIEPLIAPIRELTSQLPATALGDVELVRRDIDRVLALFGPLKDVISSGKVEQGLTEFIEKTLDQTSSLFTPGGEVARVLQELEEFLDLFQAMLKWKDHPPGPEQVAALISRGLAGMAPDLLSNAHGALLRLLAPLATVLPAGEDLTAWRNLPQARLAFWQGIEARVAPGVALDWASLEAELRAEMRAMIELTAVRDRLLHATISNLARVHLEALPGIGEQITAIALPRDFRLTPIVAGIRRLLQTTVAQLEDWNPTDDEVRQLVQSLVDGLVEFIEHSPMGQLRTVLIDFQQRALNAVESLPFQGLALEAEDALRRLAAAIEVLDPDLLRKPVHDFFSGIESKLDDFSGDAVRNAVGTLWSGVEQTLEQVNKQIDRLRATLEGLVAQLQGLAEDVEPAMESVSSGVVTLKTALDDFDLEQPASAVIEELHKLRDKVAGLDVSSLPAPAVSALKAGAEFLRQLDLAGTVNPPLNDMLAKADPTALLQQAAEKIAGVTARLKLLDPAGLAVELDRPVDELLGALSRVGPEQFTRLVQEALKPVEEAIRALDFAQFLAPITRLHAEITAKVDAVLDPDRIFAPLDALFKPIVDVVDGLRPSRFIERLQPHAGGLAEKLGGAAGPPAQFAKANLRDTMPPGPETEEDLFGFRVGDLLVPLIDLHRQLTQAFDRLDDAVLSDAGRAVREALQGRLDALNPEQVALDVGGTLGTVRAEFDPGALSVRLVDAVGAYHGAVDKLARAAQGLPPADAASAERAMALLDGMNPLGLLPERVQFDGVVSASLRLQSDLDLGGLRAAFPHLSRVQTLLPEFLRAPELTAAAIRQALRDLDPTPLRLEINTLFDRIGQRIVALQEHVFLAVEELGRAMEEFLIPVSPGTLVQLADRLHAGLEQQVLAFHPSRFKDEVKLVFDVVKRQLAAFDPAVIVQELNGLRDALIQKLRDLAGQLVVDGAPFHAMQARLAELKPSHVLAPLIQTLKPVSDLVAQLDPKVLFEPLIEAIARIREQASSVIEELEAAIDEVLAAFPQGGVDSVSVSASAQASTA